MIQLTHHPIDPALALAEVAHPDAGSNLLFLGTTRRWTGNVETTELHYECYEAMALSELNKLCQQATRRWELLGICIIHRLGPVPVGETSVAVAVSSPHRAASFEAGQWIIDRLKQVVPVWKQETDGRGQTRWVHPEEARHETG
jgi:molybdopterin synthase catalytic subunit